MGRKTGNPRGRPKGARNKRTEKLEAEVRSAAATLEKAIPEAFKGDAHAFLMAIYKDPEKPDSLRVDAAKAAIRYERPALAAIEHMGKGGGPIEISDAKERLAHILARQAAGGSDSGGAGESQ